MKQLTYEKRFTEWATWKKLDVYFNDYPEKRAQIREIWKRLGKKMLAYLWINGFKSIDTITPGHIRFCSEPIDLHGAWLNRMLTS